MNSPNGFRVRILVRWSVEQKRNFEVQFLKAQFYMERIKSKVSQILQKILQMFFVYKLDHLFKCHDTPIFEFSQKSHHQ